MSNSGEECHIPDHKSFQQDGGVLWIMVITPVVLAFGLVVIALLFGTPRLDANVLMAESQGLPAIQLSEKLHSSSDEEAADCVYADEVGPWANSVVLPGDKLPTGAYPACEQLVWSSSMTVGQHSDGEGTTIGYDDSIEPPVGEMDDAAFTYWRRDFVVDGLSYREGSDGPFEFILDLDNRLPIGMVLHVGGMDFPLPYAQYSSEETNYAWLLEADPKWADGQGLKVSLSHNPGLKSEPERVW